MYQLLFTTRFKKDLKKIKKNTKDFSLTREALRLLKTKGVAGINKRMKPHNFSGKYKDNWGFHIKPDLLIILIQIESPKIIKLVRIGSHSEFFR